MTGGVAAMAGAWVLGPRMGRYDANGKPVPIPGHNVALAILGTFILWFGWYGFNPGSGERRHGGLQRLLAGAVLAAPRHASPAQGAPALHHWQPCTE
jgi:Amt family ammonium transporter